MSNKISHNIPLNTGYTIIPPGYRMIKPSTAQQVLAFGKPQNAQRADMLLRSYTQKLVDDEKMLRFRDVKKMNILDTTEFLSPPDDGYGLPDVPKMNFKEQVLADLIGWYVYIPCFEKGALKLNTFRYITFEVLEIDPEIQSVKIYFRDHMKITDSFWQMGVGITVDIKISGSKGHKHDISLRAAQKQGFEDLYTMYSAKDLGWSDSDYQFWMDVVVANARETQEDIIQRTGIDQCDQLAHIATLLIVRCNILLEMCKPSRPIKTKGNGSANRKTSYEKGSAPERKIRTVGALRIQSKQVPKRPCLETVVTYRTAKWQVRGHVRRYKNGKEVYIKPSTRTRKALAETNEATATTIRFKKKGK